MIRHQLSALCSSRRFGLAELSCKLPVSSRAYDTSADPLERGSEGEAEEQTSSLMNALRAGEDDDDEGDDDEAEDDEEAGDVTDALALGHPGAASMAASPCRARACRLSK